MRAKLSIALAILALASCSAAAPAGAVVGGTDAAPGEYPAVAEVTYGPFLCSGTLIDSSTVLTAGHCSSVTGAVIGTPVTWPAQLIDVRIGSNKPGQGERVPVSSVVAHENYLATSGYDISLLRLAHASSKAPAKVAAAGERSIWNPGVKETIVGWGTTSESGSAPGTLQKAQVPITTDAYCSGAYSDFDVATMVCAGYPQGGVDTCQGDSGGPMFGHNAAGALRVVGSTSFGEGCARQGKPGVYARVGDSTLREWIRARAPGGVG